ncbi:ATP-binding protein [Evansella sp. AB-P1]|uniref:ATP-binding protein n=1 Tax=Evansella sp. AB-P1 TaxID=3037653 RepID=UPI00241C87B7|nr:ATP-binding protein [Evansella sp. AB-P1]MDG5788627.1 ATP-binding protein [Evansella sp. AB-P1]
MKRWSNLYTLLVSLLFFTIFTFSGLYFFSDNALLISFLFICCVLFGFYVSELLKNILFNKKMKTLPVSFNLEKEKELLYDSLFENNSDGILVVDTKGRVIDGNPAIVKLSGYSIEEFKEIELSSFVVQEDLEKKFNHTYKALGGLPQEYSISVINKAGDKLYVLIKMVPIIVNEEVVGLFEIIKDVTESKKLEEMMYRSDQLNAIGQLAAGIAHEIRNPLTSLKGFVQLSKKELPNEYVNIMEEELERINQIVGEFLFLSKPQKVTFVSKNLKNIVVDVVNFIQPEALLKNVEIQSKYDRDVFDINCEENQLKQVFINVLKNAIEAMPNGGKIYINIKKGKNFISMKIKDEGIGIPKEILDKIGKPFYTTKQTGTGLGILVCQRIIDSHGGTFIIESEVGKGTTVEILFPLLEKSTIETNGIRKDFHTT